MTMEGDDMNSKTVIGIAVASTFGWAVAAHAAPSHQTNWVAAGEEQYPPMLMFDRQSAAALAGNANPIDESVGSTAASGGSGALGGIFPSENAKSNLPGLSGHDPGMTMIEAPDAFAADSGIYADYYVVTWTPAAAGDWHTRVIALDPESEAVLPLNDADLMVSTYEVILLPGDV